MTNTHNGRPWAYVGALLGGAVSIAANIAHSYVPPAGALAGWRPETGAVIGAVFWPAALFVAVEILARVAWPSGRRWWLLRFAGLVPVAAVAAGVSYGHLSGLLAHYGEGPWIAGLGPLAVDGLMVMATGALIATGRRSAQPAAVGDPVPGDDAKAADTTPPGQHVRPAAEPSSDAAEPADEPPLVDVSRAKAIRPRVLTSADKVRRAADRMPGAKVAAIAAKAGVSESTARRHLRGSVASPTSRPPAEMAVNGHRPTELVEADA